jgi:hypothetical protein
LLIPLKYLSVSASLPFILVPFAVFLVYIIQERRDREKREAALQLEQCAQLVGNLRVQRHDYRNMLQTILCLASLGKIDEIQERISQYATGLSGSLATLSLVDNPVLQAPLLIAENRARELGIKFELTCRANLKNFKHSPLKVFQILSNVLEDSVDMAALQRESPAVRVGIVEDGNGYSFNVHNNSSAPRTMDRESAARLADLGGGFSLAGGELTLRFPRAARAQKSRLDGEKRPGCHETPDRHEAPGRRFGDPCYRLLDQDDLFEHCTPVRDRQEGTIGYVQQLADEKEAMQRLLAGEAIYVPWRENDAVPYRYEALERNFRLVEARAGFYTETGDAASSAPGDERAFA